MLEIRKNLNSSKFCKQVVYKYYNINKRDDYWSGDTFGVENQYNF